MCVDIAHLAGGSVALRDSKKPGREPLCFTAAEWSAFRQGVQAGELSRLTSTARVPDSLVPAPGLNDCLQQVRVQSGSPSALNPGPVRRAA
ncbi:DUF397 domain-containing protein [Streptomyces sp. NPDC059819]|uniref:DUF397 domain-containing protein n=1 Tax=Streptomyces sp. NPDC059819 TaxID=3346963 RepID=UPI003663F6AC